MKAAQSVRVIALLVCGCSTTWAQAPAQDAPLGLVVQSLRGQVGKASVTDGSTIYSGDSLSTEEGGSLLVRIGALALGLESSTTVHIYRAPYGAVVELSRGSVTFMTPGTHENLGIVASDVRVTPVLTVPDSGRVSLDGPCSVSVYSRRGQVTVQVGTESRLVEQGKAYRVRPENEISYREHISPDANDYHNYHDHRPCAAAQTAKGHSPIAAGQSRFLIISVGLAAAATTFAISEAFESPDRPK
jgi:hypothetical protein